MEVDHKMMEVEKMEEERVLPSIVLRVLLVEADDSTRHVITALLRKCSYRVAAVPDGLKAWETLKRRPHDVDLILTEVELPSISGFTLLTLVMEHDVCKNIPIIMMSSNDSISTVLKCMLKGAADFLIKPIRKNELKNLWQHVWRRQTLIDGRIPQNLTVQQYKVEASSENNAASNHSSEYVSFRKKNKECSEKGNDTQSSCTTLYLEAESGYMPNMQGLSQLKDGHASSSSNMDIEENEHGVKLDKEYDISESNSGGSEVAASGEAYTSTPLRLKNDQAPAETMTGDLILGPGLRRGNDEKTCEIDGCNNEQDEPFRAIDLIGKFDNQPKHTYAVSGFDDASTNKVEFVPQLELSLSSPNNQETEKRHILNHSNASAFSWYNNCKTLQPFSLMLSTNCAKPEEAGAGESHEPLSNQLSGNSCCTSQRHHITVCSSQENSTPLLIAKSQRAGRPLPNLQLSPVSVPGVSAGYGHVSPSMIYTQTRPTCQQEQPPFLITSLARSNPEISNLEQGNRPCEDAINGSNQSLCEENKLEPPMELKNDSSTATLSATSSLCNNGADRINSSAQGSVCSNNDGNVSSTAVVDKAAAPENLKYGKFFIHEGFKGKESHRSSEREAALLKFRLKRKDRCYEKKVRYQSRKRLAEQRPRVKGQFVRLKQTDTPFADAGS